MATPRLTSQATNREAAMNVNAKRSNRSNVRKPANPARKSARRAVKGSSQAQSLAAKPRHGVAVVRSWLLRA
jgi:hypothetical protein